MKPQRITGATREQVHPTHGPIAVLDQHHQVDAGTWTRKSVTEWAPTEEERRRLMRGASVFLAVAGPVLPFVDMWVGEPPR